VLGLESDLRSITLDDVNAYFRDRYAPQSAVLTVVGAFEPKAMLAEVKKAFDPVPRRSAPAVKPPPLAGPHARGLGTIPGRVPMLVAGWRAPGSADASTASLELLARVLSANTGSPLMAGGHFSQTRAGVDARRDASLFYAVGLSTSRADSAEAEQTLVDAVEKLATEPVRAEDLDRAKREYEYEWLSSQETVRGRGRALGAALLTDGAADAAARRLEQIRNLTPADLQAVAASVLKPDARSVVWMVPDGSGAAGREESAR
jgi:zinc protease